MWHCRTLPVEDTTETVPGKSLEGMDPRIQELREWLEQELQQQGKEQHRSILKCKEQHVAEVPA